jgi:tRNA threonylcarbamoyladenosine modification (KEOPS) complex  Pcc1 subunit
MNWLGGNLRVKSLQATVTLEYKDEKTAEAIAQAVSPDNFKTPVGLKVKTVQDSNKVITEIECKGKLATFTATIDDLLFSASTAEKTLHSITKTK